MAKGKTVGLDIGGAHLKAARAEDGVVVDAVTLATPIWFGLDRLRSALREIAPLWEGADRIACTMTGELSDVFPSRAAGVAGLLQEIAAHLPAERTVIYAGRRGLVGAEAAAGLVGEVASANWHATAMLAGRLAGPALFADMGSTTTDLVATAPEGLLNEGYSDAERLVSGELVYTGFTRTFLFGVASAAPVRGRMVPLMNEYFASMADAHRILGMLDEADDLHATADGKEKTIAASAARLARMVGHDAADLPPRDWRDLALWFSEQQLRAIHDAAFRVARRLPDEAPLVGAGIGRRQLRRLAGRLERRFVDFADLVPAIGRARNAASSAAPAAALALLAGDLLS